MTSFEPNNFNILIVDDTSANLKTLTAILPNLAVNAMDAMPRGGKLAIQPPIAPDLYLQSMPSDWVGDRSLA